MRTQHVLFRMFLCLLIICTPAFAGNGFHTYDPASTSCLVTESPYGSPTSVVGDADGSGDHLGWLQRNGPPTANLKFIVKFKSGAPIVKSVQQFRSIGGNVSTPFTFPYWGGNLNFGQANVTIKDDFNACKTQIQLVDNGFEATDVPKFSVGGSTIDSQIVTSGIGTIESVIVSMQVQMTWNGDMLIRLIGPDATNVVLMDDVGGSTDNAGTGFFHGQRTVFDDLGSTNITSGSAPYVGTFQPQNPLTPFAGKTGAGANGTWTLEISDDYAGGDNVTLVNWALIIND